MHTIYLLLILDIFLTLAAQVSLRIGAARLDSVGFSIILEPLRNPFILSGLILYAVSFFLYVFILSKLRLNIVYPVATGTILVLITLISYTFFKETLTLIQGIGIVAILIGTILVLLPK